MLNSERKKSVVCLMTKVITRKGWCPRTGKGQRLMGKEAVNGNIST